MSAPVKVGDRVKVTLEGVVAGVAEAGENGTYELRVQVDGQDHFVYTDTATIETVEPPVTVFKPGDVVRGRVGGRVYTLADAGFVSHHTGTYVPVSDPFTSEYYERVELP